jgi:hypothetical protein
MTKCQNKRDTPEVFRSKSHKGVVLDRSHMGFDKNAACFASIFWDKEKSNKIYLAYTGASDLKFSDASIGLAESDDGLNFRKLNEVNPLVSSRSLGNQQCVTPVIFVIKDAYYMVFSTKPFGGGRRICLAWSDEIRGPWHYAGELIRPRSLWEGYDIDLGPSIVKLTEDEVLIYYSNVSNKRYWDLLFGPKYWHRRIGVLRLKITSSKSFKAYRFCGNPLGNLNGSAKSWNESLFCPGYMNFEGTHYLFPATSTYSVGYPYTSCIGLVADTSPYFQNPSYKEILIDGPREKQLILPTVKSEITFDSPCPIIMGDKLHLYYSVMDRADEVWREALTIFDLNGRYTSSNGC